VKLSLFRDILGGAIVFGFIGALVALFIVPVPEKNHDLIVFMLGQISGFVGAVVGYHYHTSATSAKKDEMLLNATKVTDDDASL
jgi:hypothetical protein